MEGFISERRPPPPDDSVRYRRSDGASPPPEECTDSRGGLDARTLDHRSLPEARSGHDRWGDVRSFTGVCFSAAMLHFAATNYIRTCGQGVPMGDVLSCAALKLFKRDRSRARSSVEGRESVRFRSAHVQLIHLHGRNMLVLDVCFYS